jgi:hypothetical protein
VLLPAISVEVAKKLVIVQTGHQYWTCLGKDYELQSYFEPVVMGLRSSMAKLKVFDVINAKTKLAPVHV